MTFSTPTLEPKVALPKGSGSVTLGIRGFIAESPIKYFAMRICGRCDDIAADHDSIGGDFGYCTVLDGVGDDARPCGCSWNGRTGGCSEHAPLDLSCALCVQIGLENHKSQPALSYSMTCGGCGQSFMVHCFICAPSKIADHEESHRVEVAA